MQEIALEVGVAHAFDALSNDRLAILCGAGLSMAPPSSLPSAARLAASAKQKHDARYGTSRPPLPTEIEAQAEYFFRRGELATVYFQSLIDFNAFAGPPNPGHLAVADLLLVRGIQTGVTTNVDILIEAAGLHLFGQIATAVDGLSAGGLPADRAPLLKVHGCRQSDPDNMVWAPGQLAVAPVAGRIASSKAWLEVRLQNRDLVIVGYWTDWDYLNSVLEETIGTVRPARVIVVDPADGATFQAKAPELFKLGRERASEFLHVSASGADFLDALRLEFSRSFVRRVLHSGSADYQILAGHAAAAEWIEPPKLDNETFWRVRRDLEGCFPNQPALNNNPSNEPLIGVTLLQLQAKGAAADGQYWLLKNCRIRIIRAANQPLHRIEAEYEGEMAPMIAPDIVIAIGAEACVLPTNFARSRTPATIARGTSSKWMTRQEAVQELGL